MYSLRYFSIAFIISLALGSLLFLWALFQPKSGSWVTVYTDSWLDDRETGGMLKKQGFSVVSESSLWVLLDDFSGIKQIPLDKYGDFVESFDPRNDGFAEKLRAFFVQGGERRFYLDKGGLSPARLETILDETLGPGRGVLWKMSYPGEYNWEPVSLLLFAAASLLSFVFLGRSRFFYLFCTFPVLAFLPFAGPSGLAAAGILLAVVFLLREPLMERFSAHRGISRIVYRSLAGELHGWFQTFPFELSGALTGLVLYWVSCVLGNIPLRISLPAFCFLAPLMLLLPWAEAHGSKNIYPFSVQKNQLLLIFPPVLPVFTIAFALAFGIFTFQGSADVTESIISDQAKLNGVEWPSLPGPDAYYRHAAFQRSFSQRSLKDDHFNVRYGTYRLGPDGLIDGFSEISPAETVPPYPEILVQLGKEPKDSGWRKLSRVRGVLLLALMTILSVPALLRIVRYRKKKHTMI